LKATKGREQGSASLLRRRQGERRPVVDDWDGDEDEKRGREAEASGGASCLRNEADRIERKIWNVGIDRQ